MILALEKSKEILYNIEQNQEKVDEQLRASQDEESVGQVLELYERNLELYISLFSQYDEALRFTHKDKEDQQNSEAEKAVFLNVAAYLNLQRQFAVLARNQVHVNHSLLKFLREDGLKNTHNLSTKKAIKLKLTTPQEIVKYCDNYHQVLNQIMEIERLNTDLSMFKKLDVLDFNSKAIRCFFVGLLYYSNDKFQEAVSLLKYAEDLFKITHRKYQENLKLVTHPTPIS